MDAKIVFRCDSSPDIGMGHLIRCLAVARELGANNNIAFAAARDSSNSLIINSGFGIFLKESSETEENFLERAAAVLNPGIIVIDRKHPYKSAFLDSLKKRGTRIIMIDNICPGLSSCDEIVFPSADLDKSLLKGYTSQGQIDRIHCGFDYVILRDEVLAVEKKAPHGLHNPPKIAVTTGGADPEGILIRLVPLLIKMSLNADYLLLAGDAFKFKEELPSLEKKLPGNFRIEPYSLQKLIKCDIVICTFGVSVYEMIYLQKPAICISHNGENAHSAKILGERHPVIEDAGYFKDISQEKLHRAISKLITDKEYYNAVIRKCSGLIDGKGAKRAAEIIMGKVNHA